MALDSILNVNQVQPLDPSHKFARDMMGLWVPLPHLTGGSKFYDVSGEGLDGTLQGMDPATDWNVGDVNSGPYLDFDGIDDWVDAPRIRGTLDNGFTIFWAHWLDPSAKDADPPMWSFNTGAFSNSGDNYLQFRHDQVGYSGGGTPYCFKFGVGTGSVDAVGETEANTSTTGEWIRGLVTWKPGEEPILYTDGTVLPWKSNAQPGTYSGSVPTNVTGIGRGTKDGFFVGRIAYFGILGRKVSADEALLLDQMAQDGFSDVLNQRTQTGLFDLSPPPSFILNDGGETISMSGHVVQVSDVVSSPVITTDSATVGTLSLTEGAELVAGVGQTLLSGALAVQDGLEAFTTGGSVLTSGSASLTEGLEALTIAGGTIVSGTSSLADSPETTSSSGNVLVSGDYALVDGPEGISGSGTAFIAGTSSILDGGEILSLGGSIYVLGTAALQDAGEVLAIAGGPVATGTASLLDASEVVTASGIAIVGGTVALVDSGEIIAMSEKYINRGSLSLADSPEIPAISGNVFVSGAASLTDDLDVLVLSGNVLGTGSLSMTDGLEVPSLSGIVTLSGALGLTDGAEIPSLSGQNFVSGAASLTEGLEVITMSGNVRANLTGTLAFSTGSETIAVTGGTKASGSLSLTDNGENILILVNNALLRELNVRVRDAMTIEARIDENTFLVRATVRDTYTLIPEIRD